MQGRLIKMFRLLIDDDVDHISILSDRLNVTQKTVRNYIKEINEVLIANSFEKFQVNRGKLVNNLSPEQIEKIKGKFILSTNDQLYLTSSQRIIYLLFIFLESEGPIFFVDIQNDLQVSKSTMDEDLRNFRRLLKRYDLVLITNKKQGANIVGNERAIRAMFGDVLNRENIISSFFNNDPVANSPLVSKIEKVFSYENIMFVKNTILEFFPNSGVATNNSYCQQATIFMLVWISRIKQSQNVSDGSKDKGKDISQVMGKFLEKIKRHFNFNLENLNEIKYISYIIGSFNNDGDYDIEDWSKAQVFTIKLINVLEKKLKFPFSKSESLFERLYQHVLFLFLRKKQNIDIANPLTEMIKQSYTTIYKEIVNFIDNDENIFQNKLSEDEICYLVVYFSTAELEVQNSMRYKCKVAVVCNYGVATGHLIAAKLREHFNLDVLAVLGANEIGTIKKLPVKLVFKTVNIKIDDVPSVRLNPILNKQEIDKVSKFLQQHSDLLTYEENKLDPTKFFKEVLNGLILNGVSVSKEIVESLQNVFQINHVEISERSVKPMLQDLLNENEIQLNVLAKDWRDAIRVSAAPLLNAGKIRASYVDAMISSVEKYGPYIVIGPSLALAHARPEDGANQLAVSVTTLEEPISFGNSDNDPVKIIFCLAAVDDYSHLNVMKAIVQLISDQEKINRLADIQDKKEFQKTLFQNNSNQEEKNNG